MTQTIELPRERRKPVSLNPHVMIIYSLPKAGKTSIVSQLQDSLLIELEDGGADYNEACVIEAHKPSEFENILTAVENNEKPYKYIIIDTISKLDAWSEIVGTYNYMNKPQGQKFNRDGREMILHTDSRFETVHQLPNGFGYQHSRQQMVNWYERICALSSNIILLAHIKDKMIESKTGDSVEAIDLDLTGKVKNIYASRADAIGYFYRKGNQGILNFNNEYKVICGGRCAHLNGEIVISEKNEKGDIITHWNKIYI